MHPRPILPIVHYTNPCGGMPTLNTVGTPSVTQQGDCSIQNLVVSTQLTTSASLPTGASVEYRAYWGTSGTPSFTDPWTTWSGFTGANDTLNNDLGFFTTDSGAGSGSPTTYYYAIQFRLIGTDGSTVCDGPDQSSTISMSVYDCFI